LQSVDPVVVNAGKILPSVIAEYEQVEGFYADEFGLFFNVLPNKSLVMTGETWCGRKHSKDPLTVLIGVNMDGS
jgi:hypothetical protein